MPLFDDTPPLRCLDCIVLRQHEVQDVLRLLNANKASGPDAIHAKLLKVAYDIKTSQWRRIVSWY
jgi:hypothetical protein